MASVSEKLMFYHIPKTGGVWVKEAMRKSGIPNAGVPNISKMGHPFGLKREHATYEVIQEEYKKDKFSFCFVRNPIDWYKSFWRFRQAGGPARSQHSGRYDFKFPLDICSDNNFELFLEKSLALFPEGFVTKMYKYFVGENCDKVNYIGKLENIREDLIDVLKQSGEIFNEDVIRNYKKINISTKIDLTINKDLEKRLLKTERWVTETFYKE